MTSIVEQMASGTLTAATVALWYLVALVVGAAAGAAGGLVVGGAAIGRELAAMMGMFYGLVAVVPGVLAGLTVLALV